MSTPEDFVKASRIAGQGRVSIAVGLVVAAAVLVLVGGAKLTVPFPQAHAQAISPAQGQNRVMAVGQTPLSFEPNQGQTDPNVKFLARGAGYALFLTDHEAVLKLQHFSRKA